MNWILNLLLHILLCSSLIRGHTWNWWNWWTWRTCNHSLCEADSRCLDWGPAGLSEEHLIVSARPPAAAPGIILIPLRILVCWRTRRAGLWCVEKPPWLQITHLSSSCSRSPPVSSKSSGWNSPSCALWAPLLCSTSVSVMSSAVTSCGILSYLLKPDKFCHQCNLGRELKFQQSCRTSSCLSKQQPDGTGNSPAPFSE